MSPKYVDLQRRFQESRADLLGPDPYVSRAVVRALVPELSWEDLLELSCVVILGEAGTGKTTEFKEQARLLSSQSRVAFFVSINALVSDGIPNCLGPEDRRRLRQWLEQPDSQPAWFFLDSLDEAKLKGRSLEEALRKLEQGLLSGFQRARVYLSCRASDWKTVSDLQALEELLPSDSAQVVEFVPLDEERQRRLAEFLGVVDVDDFFRAVAEADARSFMDRPGDVAGMARYWLEKRELGRFEKLIDHNVREKLREVRDREGSLSPECSYDGVCQLAAVAILTGRRFFQIPDIPLDVKPTDRTMDPQQALPGWRPEEIRALLTLPIFDEATYGRVMFHHRSVSEYLAARWLYGLLDKGLPRRELDRLLWREHAGYQLCPAYLADSIAWLALRDRDVRRRAIQEIPEIVLNGGDPASLPGEDQAAALCGYLQKYRGRQRLFHTFDRACLRRLACPEVDLVVREQLLAGQVSGDLLEILLQVAEQGHFGSCAESALHIAQNREQRLPGRAQAIHTVGAAGASEQKLRLWKFFCDEAGVEHEIASALIEALFPDPLGMEGALHLLCVAKPGNPRVGSELDTTFNSLAKKCTAEQQLQLLGKLLELVETQQSSRPWLIDPLGGFLSGVLKRYSEADYPPVVRKALEVVESSEQRSEFNRGVIAVKRSRGQSTFPFRQLKPGVSSTSGISPEDRPAVRYGDPKQRAQKLAKLKATLPEIRAGRHMQSLWHLADVGKSRFSRGEISFQKIEEEYGEEIAQAAQEGWSKVWRTLEPPIRHQIGGTGIPPLVVRGLTSLEAATQNGLDFGQLEPELARKAVQFAVWELGSFPKWLEALARDQPNIVRAVLAEELEAEWSAAHPPHPSIWEMLAHAPEIVRQVCVPVIWNLLEQEDLPSPGIFGLAAEAAWVALTSESERLSSLASQRCKTPPFDSDRSVIWWILWLESDAKAAMDYLEKVIASMQRCYADKMTALIVGICAQLWSWQKERSPVKLSLPRRVPVLRRLIPLVFRYVRPEQDLASIAPSPRDQLLAWLKKIPGEESIHAFLDLAKDVGLERYRDQFLHDAEQRALDDVSSDFWSVAQCLEWSQKFTKAPETSSELFQVALDRLDDIRGNIERGDFSVRSLFGDNTVELDVQKWLAGELEQRSRGHYTVHREEEVDHKKKPDIRLNLPACSGPVSIEVKIAGKWTGQQLRNHLQSQLVDQYLRDPHSNRGIYLLCSMGKPKRWKIKESPLLDFQTLVLRLNQVACEIQTANPNVQDLRVIGIDFHKPPPVAGSWITAAAATITANLSPFEQPWRGIR